MAFLLSQVSVGSGGRTLPVGDLHAEGQAHLRKDLLDLLERLAAEVLRLQHLGLGLLHQIADVDDVVVLQAVRRADRQFQFVHLLQQSRVERQVGLAVRLLDSLSRLFGRW